MNERTKAVISAAVVILANIASLWGVSIDQGVWVNGLCAVVTLVASVWAIWKNHNFSAEAIQAQATLDHLRAEKKALEAKEELEDED